MADDEAREFELVENQKAKSDLWDHFLLKRNKKWNTIQQGQAVCRHCNAEVKHANGTTNLATHMARHHSGVKVGGKRSKSTSVGASKDLPQKKPKQQTLQSVFTSTYSAASDRALAITQAICPIHY